MLALQDLTDIWGRWFSKKYGTTCKFTASTDYNKQDYFLKDYHQYQCTTTVQSIDYDSGAFPADVSKVAYEIWYDNGSKIQQSNTLSNTSTTTNTFMWSLTETLNVGVEVSATVGTPNVASATTKYSVNMSLSSTQSSTKTETKTWTVSNPVLVPAESSVKCEMLLNAQNYNMRFTAPVLVAGHVAIWNDKKIDLGGTGDHWLYFIPIEDVLRDVMNNNLASTSGYTISGGGIIAKARGVFNGSQTISVGVKTSQYPLRTMASANGFRVADASELYLSAVPAANIA